MAVSDSRGEGEIRGVKPPAKICNCKLLLPPGEYKRKAISPFAKVLWCLLYYTYYTTVMSQNRALQKITSRHHHPT